MTQDALDVVHSRGPDVDVVHSFMVRIRSRLSVMTSMLKSCLGAAILCTCGAAQEPANPLLNSEKGIYHYLMGTVVAAAQEMPEKNYSYKPTSTVRTFGQLIAHEADAQYEFCSAAGGESNGVRGIDRCAVSRDYRLRRAEAYQARSAFFQQRAHG
jgi:hypothetical protein